MSSLINLNGSTPAAAPGYVLGTWQKGSTPAGTDPTTGQPYYDASVQVPIPASVVGFGVPSGTTAAVILPVVYFRAGAVTKCKVYVQAADATTALTFTIKQNGTSVFTAPITLAAGTTPGLQTFTSLTASPLAIAADDIFTLVITAGASAWALTAQLES